MVRKQIYLTEEEQRELKAIAITTGARQSELIRTAIDNFIAVYKERDRKKLLMQAKGIWKDRDDLPDIRQMRSEWERK